MIVRLQKAITLKVNNQVDLNGKLIRRKLTIKADRQPDKTNLLGWRIAKI